MRQRPVHSRRKPIPRPPRPECEHPKDQRIVVGQTIHGNSPIEFCPKCGHIINSAANRIISEHNAQSSPDVVSRKEYDELVKFTGELCEKVVQQGQYERLDQTSYCHHCAGINDPDGKDLPHFDDCIVPRAQQFLKDHE